MPRFLVEELAAHVTGRERDDLVFPGAKGGALRVGCFGGAAFDEAVEAVGVAGMHPHELRHTAPSLAIASRGDPKMRPQVLKAVNEDGWVLLSSTTVGGRVVGRICILGHRTDAARVHEAVEATRRHARRVAHEV